MAALARREHSRRELERKLQAKGHDRGAIAAALDDLARRGLQDDRRFAEAYARERAERGFGPRRIALELRERGVDDAAARQGLAAVEGGFEGRARDVRRRKFRRDPASFAERARQTRFLEYRGFEAEQIRYALGHSIDDEDL